MVSLGMLQRTSDVSGDCIVGCMLWAVCSSQELLRTRHGPPATLHTTGKWDQIASENGTWSSYLRLEALLEALPSIGHQTWAAIIYIER